MRTLAQRLQHLCLPLIKCNAIQPLYRQGHCFRGMPDNIVALSGSQGKHSFPRS